MAAIGLGIHFVLPQLAGLRATGAAIAQARWWVPVALVGLEAASIVAYGQLLTILLRRSGQPVRPGFVWRVTTVANAVGRALPGGSGSSLAIMIASFRSRRYDPVRCASAVWGAGLLSSAILGLLLPVGAAIGMIGGHGGRIGLSAAVAAVAVVGLAVFVPVALRDPDRFARRVATLLNRGVPGLIRRRLHVDAIVDGARRGASNIRDLASDRAVLRQATALAVANWLLDIAVVVILALTVGAGTPLAAILLAYVVAQIASAIPLTPGGVGLVETAMIGALVASGAPAAAATATVLGWRLVSHWLPIPIGLGLLPTVGTPRHQGSTANR